MKHIVVTVLLASCLIGCAASSAPRDEWRAAVTHILATQAGIQAGDTSGAAGLAGDIDVLSRFIERGGVRDAALASAYYYRAEARVAQNSARRAKREKLDAPAARAALADFDKAIALNPDPLTVADAEYQAGGVANWLGDLPLAFSYWRRCAELDHAGCLNVLAYAKLSGFGGEQIDVEQSLELNKKVFKTGIAYTCAGAVSALMIATTIHFSNGGGDAEALTWLGRAYGLLDELAAAHNGADICGRSSYQIAEFLIRLGQGERRATLIEQARDHARGAYIKAIAQYMLGSIDDAALREVLASESPKMEACDAHFDALWYLELSKRHDKAQEHFDAMARLGTTACGVNLFFARRLGYRTL
jgi:tetratricopeptide (TPR) repeat protein